MKTLQKVRSPYYMIETSYSVDNKEKAILGETGFYEALSDYPILVNVTYGKRQKDIDHLVFTANSVVMNECKNTNEGFFMHYSWLLSHVVDRFSDGLPIAQYYAHTMGYNTKDVKFTLTIPKLNCKTKVKKTLKNLKINVIETETQLLREEDKQLWIKPIRNGILSVFNNIEDCSLVDYSIGYSNVGIDVGSVVEYGFSLGKNENLGDF